MRWSFVLLAACGSTAAPDPNDPVSGSRLRVVVDEFADGTRVLASRTALFDKDRNEDCTVTLWADGVYRCTPAAYTVVYRDEDCTLPLGEQAADDPHAAIYFLAPSLNDPPTEMHVPRAVAATPPSVFKHGPGGTCFEESPSPGDKFFELGPEISRDLAVTTRAELPTDEPISVLEMTSSDGLHVQSGLFDRAAGAECFTARIDDATLQCQPATPADFSSLFLDSGCTQPVHVAARSKAPALVWREGSETCIGIFDVGAEVAAATTVYAGVPGNCTARAVGADEHVLALTEHASPQLTRDRVPGDRLDRIEDGGHRLRELALFDHEIDSECAASDGRCKPPATAASPGFADASCTTPLLYARVPDHGCRANARFASENGVDYREIGAARAAFVMGETCIPVPDAHAVGDVVPPETFAAATRRAD